MTGSLDPGDTFPGTTLDLPGSASLTDQVETPYDTLLLGRGFW
jgi:hypothetical protein